MKTETKKRPLRRLLKALGLGIIDSVPILSSIKSNLNSEHNENLPENGKGKIDVMRLIVTVGIVTLITLFALGKIEIDELTVLINLIKENV